MSEKLDMHTKDITQENVEKIALLFPNCVVESLKNGEEIRTIDFDALRQELSNYVVDGPTERYQFTWPDKSKAKLLANTPINMTLRPCPEESVNFDKTENLYIEGDNLDVLKLLRETYLGKVKMIYIDPPYNTGNDFVYNDKFSIDSKGYAEISGDYDDENNRLELNSSSNGRFHTDWLNMMYPRLKISRDFLKDDGAIFISIDDGELNNLLNICDEIFGKTNHIATFPWRKRTAKSDVPFGVSQDYEWVVAYAKSSQFRASITGKKRKYHETPDLPGRPWRTHDLTKQTTSTERPNSFFTIVNPKTGDKYTANPNRTWCITKDTFNEYYEQNRIVFPGDYSFLKNKKPLMRYFKSDDVAKAEIFFGSTAVSTKLPDSVGMSQDGTKEITSLFGKKIFNFPKPLSLMEYLIEITTNLSDNEIILDYFSGSATVAHSLMKVNLDSGKRLKYILIQLPEMIEVDDSEPSMKTICDIGKERIRRAGKQILSETAQSTLEGKRDVDVGFRVLKIDSSNMKDVYYSPDQTFQSGLDSLMDNVKEDRKPMDLLFQCMLDLGIELSVPIELLKIDDKEVYDVNNGYLLACFDTEVTESVVTDIAKRKPVYAVMRDSSMSSDSIATNFEQIFKSYSPTTERRVI